MNKAPFDFGSALSQVFNTSGGAQFGRRLWFWTALPLAIVVLVTLPFIAGPYAELFVWLQTDYMDSIGGVDPDMGPMLDIFNRIWPAYLVLMFGSWACIAMGEAALHRKVLRNVEMPTRPIRFGRDELTVMAVQFLVMVIWIVAITLVTIIIVALSAGLAMVAAPLGAIIGVVGVFAIIAAMIYVPMRLLPAAALSIKTGEMQIFQALPISKGRFWPIFGAYVILYIGGSILVQVFMGIGGAIILGDANVMSLPAGADAEVMLAQAAERIKSPMAIMASVIAVIIYAAITSIWYLSMAGIGSYVVSLEDAQRPVDTFS